jgi:Ca-activated chloride channel family protein
MTHRHLPFTPQWLWWPEPWVWALLLLIVLPGLWWLWRRPSRRPAIRFSSLQTLRDAGGDWAARLRLVLPVLRIAALACLIVAVARPRRPDESSSVFAEGIAIQMVVDTSGSMADVDLSPRGTRQTRLDVVKDVFRRFVEGDGKLPGRPNDLVGMLRFAAYADSVCPLTLDHKSLLEVLAQTQITEGQEGNATAIGDGLALAVERLKDVQRTAGSGQRLTITSRVVILLTDGENNAGMLTPEQAGDMASTFGIKVYTIMAGTGGRDFFGNRIPVRDDALRQIAERSGGAFFRARNADALREVYEKIDKLERTKTEERRYVRWGELSRPWLLAAFACLCLQTLLDATRLRKIP